MRQTARRSIRTSTRGQASPPTISCGTSLPRIQNSEPERRHLERIEIGLPHDAEAHMHNRHLDRETLFLAQLLDPTDARRLDAGSGSLVKTQAATTLIRPAFRERGFCRITISTSWSSAVSKFIKRSTEN